MGKAENNLTNITDNNNNINNNNNNNNNNNTSTSTTSTSLNNNNNNSNSNNNNNSNTTNNNNSKAAAQKTMQLTKSISNNNESSLTNSTRLNANKQIASGDTGDNNIICEQIKNQMNNDTMNNHNHNSNKINNNNNNNIVITNTNLLTMTTSSVTNAKSFNAMNKNINQETIIHNNNNLNYTNNSLMENKTNLIINYLPPNMNQEEVRALFSSVGEVESCKLVREKISGESLGYAFVKFYDPLDACKAIKTLNGLRLQNKTVKVSLARPSSEAIKGANLYICGLPRKMNQSELEKLFSTCGHIITARILYDIKTGLSRGVAFIRYDQRTEAEIAIRKLNGYLPSGSNEPITVKFANSPGSNRNENLNLCFMKTIERETIPKYITNNNITQNNGTVSHSNKILVNSHNDLTNNSTCRNHKINAVQTVNTNETHNSSSPNRTIRTLVNNSQTPPPPGFVVSSNRTNMNVGCTSVCNSNCAYSNNIDDTTSSPNVGNQTGSCYSSQVLPNGFPMQLSSSNTVNNINNTRPDVGVVGPLQRLAGVARLKCQAAAVAAAAISGGAGVGFRSSTNMLGGPLASNFSTGLPTFGIDFMRGLGPSAHALLAPAFAASSGALTATGWCIFVYNLAPDTEESILWQLFGPFGAVQTVKVIRDPVTGKCKGFGFVTMSNYEEALLAIHSLNGFNLGNRVLQVSFKTTPNSRQMKYMSNATMEANPILTNLPGSVTPIPNPYMQNS